MLDRFSIKIIRSPLALLAAGIDKLGVTANQTTLFGLGIGVLLPPLYFTHYDLALIKFS